MGLRDMLKKKGGSDDDEPAITISPPPSSSSSYPQQQQQQQQQHPPPRPPPPAPLQTAEFTFIRSDTHSQEVIHTTPVSRRGDAHGSYFDEDDDNEGGSNQYLRAGDGGLTSPGGSSPTGGGARNNRRSFDVFRKSSRSSRSASVSSSVSASGSRRDRGDKDGAVESTARRLSHRLHLSRTPSTSSHVPVDLPAIIVPEGEGEGGNKASVAAAGVSSPTGGDSRTGSRASTPDPTGAVESQWEKRATMLALENEKQQQQQRSSRPTTPEQRLGSRGRGSRNSPGGAGDGGSANRSRSNSAVSTKELDASIQEAIRLHEEGDLVQSTRMFAILADPRGYNNPLSQVLYGLALRHGWGCLPDTEAAVNYLSAAASNAAAVEDMALQAGIKKGGAAKGELVLAIFELANCFRHGWGLEKDPIAAKQYYETAANLGDTDAMNEAAWCYLEGFGCKKDKFSAAKYYRLAEQNGNKTLGNSWIWKEKYDPDKQKKK